MEATPPCPFDNIALAISGGGFRAAAYGLGTLSLLHQVQWQGAPLLERVRFISSASGGSITNAYYTLRLYQGHAPDAILRDLYQKLQGDTILNNAVTRLHQSGAWQSYPHKHRNLINAFAITYDREFYGGKLIEVFDNPVGEPHVEEICIGSTELNNGHSFRFRMGRTMASQQLFGNHFLHFHNSTMAESRSLRLGDIVAASSCFPLGFEPIIFPQDFYTGNGSPEELLASMEMEHNDPLHVGEVWQKPFGLIDGGVVDNQGLYGFELEHQHREEAAKAQALKINLEKTDPYAGSQPNTEVDPEVVKEQEPKDEAKADNNPNDEEDDKLPFSLCIISDVASYFMDSFRPRRSRLGALGKVPLLAAAPSLLLATLMPFLAAALFLWQKMPWYDFVLLAPGFLFSSLIVGVVAMAWRALAGRSQDPEDAMMQVPGRTLRKHLLFIAMQPLEWWLETINNRSRSFVLLANQVFLKQIRRMYQSRLYGDPSIRPRLMSNFIYDLSRTQRDRRAKELHKDFTKESHPLSPEQAAMLSVLCPSPKVETTAEAARNVDTTLWFAPERPQDLENIVATAQFTTCYNLIRHINRYEQQVKVLPEDVAQLREQLLGKWARFQEDPRWLLTPFLELS